jgi:hypothetical protein
MNSRRPYFSDSERRDVQPVQWWQESNVPFFTAKIADMTTPDLKLLCAEIKGAVSLMQSQIESRGKANMGWWRKVSQAKGYATEKHRIVRAELHNRNQQAQQSNTTRREHRLARLRQLRHKAVVDESVDTLALVVEMIDCMLEDEGAS